LASEAQSALSIISIKTKQSIELFSSRDRYYVKHVKEKQSIQYNYTDMHQRSTCCLVTSALHQLRRAPRLLVTRPHRLYVSLAVRREYSSPGHIGSTSTSPCDATTRLRLHALHVNLAVRREYSSLGCSSSTSTTPYAAATSSSGRTTTSTTHLDWFQLEN
jgi:hypothetical protein